MRLKVRREIPLELGDCPIPMQGPQADSRMRAPRRSYQQRAVLREHIEHLLGAGRDGKAHIWVHGFALEDRGHLSISSREEFVQERC